jgi:hypothetical protein
VQLNLFNPKSHVDTGLNDIFTVKVSSDMVAGCIKLITPKVSSDPGRLIDLFTPKISSDPV